MMKEAALTRNMFTILLFDLQKYLYFRTVHVVIFILFKPTHAPFLKHIYIHIHI